MNGPMNALIAIKLRAQDGDPVAFWGGIENVVAGCDSFCGGTDQGVSCVMDHLSPPLRLIDFEKVRREDGFVLCRFALAERKEGLPPSATHDLAELSKTMALAVSQCWQFAGMKPRLQQALSRKVRAFASEWMGGENDLLRQARSHYQEFIQALGVDCADMRRAVLRALDNAGARSVGVSDVSHPALRGVLSW